VYKRQVYDLLHYDNCYVASIAQENKSAKGRGGCPPFAEYRTFAQVLLVLQTQLDMMTP
jgi:hypothetical protein